MPAAPIRKILDSETLNSRGRVRKQRPVKPDLLHGHIHIWKINLDAEESVNNARRVLSNDERLRANRFIFPRQQSRFQAGRAALRNILSFYLKQTPESIQFGYGPKGKPFLLPNAHSYSLEFNIAHSEDLMLAAFSLDKSLGIDLESEQVISAQDWIVKRYFSAKDHRIYQTLSAVDRQRAFIKAWTIKEACGKADGKGFSGASGMDHFKPQGHELPSDDFEIHAHGPYWLLHFRPEDGFTAAVAIKAARKPQPLFWEYNWNFTRNYE